MFSARNGPGRQREPAAATSDAANAEPDGASSPTTAAAAAEASNDESSETLFLDKSNLSKTKKTNYFAYIIK